MKFEKDHRLFKVYIPLFLVFLAFFWKLYYIDYRDICNDEPFTIFNSQKSIAEIIGLSSANEPTPPLFMLFTHLSVDNFGIRPVAVRLFPLIFNALTVLFIYFAGRRFISNWAGITASGLFIFSFYHFFYGLETRTYSLVSLGTAASLYYFLRYANDQSDKKALAGLIISNSVLVYSHHFGWFVIFSQTLTSLFYIRSRKSFFRFLIPPLATLIVFSPMIPVIVKQFISKSNRGTWLKPPNPSDYLHELYYFLNNKEVFNVIIIMLGAGILLTLLMIILKKQKGIDRILFVLLIWWIIPYTIMFFAPSKTPMFNNRYLLFNTIGLYLFISAAIHYLYQKHKLIEPLLGLGLLIFMAWNMKILPETFGYREVKNTVDFVKKSDTGDRIILLYPFWSDYQFNYYYNQEFFRDYTNSDELMKKAGIYKLWGLRQAKQAIAENPGKRVIYVQDGFIKEKEASIFRFLDSAFVKIDSASYPQTFKVGVYDPKPTE